MSNSPDGSPEEPVPVSSYDPHNVRVDATALEPETVSRSDVPSERPRCPILSLPIELLDAILSYLHPIDLAAVSQTCRAIRSRAIADIHWLPHVQANIPGLTLASPYPCDNYRDLYAAHDPRWFLPKYKIWFCDRHLMGKMIVVRYDPRRGCIEGYQLLAVSSLTNPQHWAADDQVIIHSFEPRVKLHLDKPVVQFHVGDRDRSYVPVSGPTAGCRFASELPMTLDNRPDHIFSNFSLARPLHPVTVDFRLDSDFPYGDVWPPPAIPSPQRVSGFASASDLDYVVDDDRPRARAEMSDRAFRIRQWMEMAGPPGTPSVMLGPGLARVLHVVAGFVPINAIGGGAPPPVHGLAGPHIGEEIITYATLDPKLYTPTELKPWRGIWVGDYSGHGCEFLLVHQPDTEDDNATDEKLGVIRVEHESDDDWEKRRKEARIYRGRLEAVKLTGDPNVPRGEHTFIVDDLGEAGLVGIAQDPPFEGARIMKSKGHVAGTGFYNDKFIDSQLLLLSYDKLAQYWVSFGHISYFQRVDLDSFLVP
ncbi:hypothetical protein SODALDRAFT_217615 [Sodiomyces alkalinus F11]|uniref:F-box domain-containing protein n=1 Tax=Sodiomyces alkalinus (strain CBS 110278 / VKM F-3762 / F11) TaxID=1314773 RepID=A0A3N2PPI0_SODAK|nr:hypothetical protein SODALDRAFT_217615 [Sodiomyces alkalinus F11]ROT36340.1 hypothetical protein SODALDRAFT_217615 [Sodiomyces alkalinus F11]